MICHMPRIFYIVQTPTMNQILPWSNESSSLSVNLLPEEYQYEKENLYERLMLLCSYVAGLSDGFAIRLHKKLSGDVI